jgi:peroxiredoxin
LRSDMVPGATLPDYELPDHRGRPTRLSAIQGIDPLIVHIARGSYCPQEHQMGCELVGMFPRIQVGNAHLVTISPNTRRELVEFKASLGAGWPFLGDAELSVAEDLDIVEYTEPVHRSAIPHTLVLGPDLEIFKIYMGYYYWGRPSMHELHNDLRTLSARIRPDWDIVKPEVRAAWEDAERRSTAFYPYGRR